MAVQALAGSATSIFPAIGDALAKVGGSELGGALASAGLSAGINSANTSKAHDRSKNWATRKYLYELIALDQAGINPAYMFADKGAALKAAGVQRAAQAPGQSPVKPNSAAQQLVAAQIRNLDAQSNSADAAAQLSLQRIDESRAAADRSGASAGLDRMKEKRLGQEVQALIDNPELIKEILEAQGQSGTNVGAFQRALEGIFGSRAAGDYGVLGGAMALFASPFVAAALAKDWSQVNKIGFLEAAKRNVSKAQWRTVGPAMLRWLARGGYIAAGAATAYELWLADQDAAAAGNKPKTRSSSRHQTRKREIDAR